MYVYNCILITLLYIFRSKPRWFQKNTTSTIDPTYESSS
jgi:hypothetical protein